MLPTLPLKTRFGPENVRDRGAHRRPEVAEPFPPGRGLAESLGLQGLLRRHALEDFRVRFGKCFGDGQIDAPILPGRDSDLSLEGSF